MRHVRRYLPYVVMYGIAFLWVIPVLWMADTAFKPQSEIFRIPPTWVPSHFSLEHVSRLFTEWPFFRWLLNSLIMATSVTICSLVVSTLAAYSFARMKWRGRDTLFVVLLVFMLLPWQVNIVPLYFMMSKFHFLNTFQGVALPIIAMPIGIFLLRQFFISIPKDIEDAAKIDGCTSFGILLRVIIPVSKPVFAAFAIFIFNFTWNDFFWSMICLKKTSVVTLPVGLRLLQSAYELDYGLVLAGALMASLPSMIIFLLLRRHIVRGFSLASSGTKG